MILGIYTDGSCRSNPGPAGYAFLLVEESTTEDDKLRYKCCGACVDEYNCIVQATNQHAELQACEKGLSYIIDKEYHANNTLIRLYSDSAYLLNCLKNQWYSKWRRNGWKTSTGDPVKNQWLWEKIVKHIEFLRLNNNKIEFIKVKGHNGNTYNELADVLANKGTELSIEYFSSLK